MGRMTFEKAPDGSWIRKAERTQPRGQGQTHFGVEEETEIRQMEGGVNPQGGIDLQSGHQQKGPELDIPPLQTEILSQIEGFQFESTFFEPIMTQHTFIEGPSTQSSYIEPSLFGLVFIEPTYIEILPPQTPPAPDHVPQIDLSAQINSLSTRMEELVVVNDTQFYFMEDIMDQYQIGFTTQFEYLQQRIDHMEQRIDHIEDHMEHQHKEMMTYLHFVFPHPSPQP